MDNWLHKDEWKFEGNGFCVVVSRHTVPQTEYSLDVGENRWCVYVYVYKSHPVFSRFDDSDSMSQHAACSIPLHGGCSFFRRHKNDKGDTTSFQAGADYNHLYDDRFTYMGKDDAKCVFNDADKLIKWMSEK